MDEEAEFTDEFADPETNARKWQFAFLVARVLAFISNVFTDGARLFAGVAEDVCNHSNYKIERAEFREDAARELEALIEGPKEA